MSGRGFIAVEPDSKCEMCGKVRECRPYGPNGESVCIECAMKDEEAAKKAFMKRTFGEGVKSDKPAPPGAAA